MQTITITGLALGFIPVGIVIVLLYRWSLDARTAGFAVARMLIQLILIGYVLDFIFGTSQSWIILIMLSIMLCAASWIAIAVGLVGVLIMVRPGAELFVLTSLLPIAAAFTYALMQMITRKLGMHDKAGTLTFYIQVAFIIIGSVVGLIAGDGRFNTESNPTFEFLFRAVSL